MNLPRRDIVPVDPAKNVAEQDPPSRPVAQPLQPPQHSRDESQLVQWLSVQAGNMAGDLLHNVRALMVRVSFLCLSRTDMTKYPAYVSNCVISNKLIKNCRPCYRARLSLAIETFQNKWQMEGQDAHAFIARIRAQSEDFARAKFTAVQRFEDSLQRRCDGQLRSHANALQDECREHVGQEEDKMLKEIQNALTQESSVCQDQLQQTLRQHVCHQECADAESHQEMDQPRQLFAQQAEAMKRFESHCQQLVSQQQEEYAHKQHTQFQQFDGVPRQG